LQTRFLAYQNFHQDFLKRKSIVVGCPKLGDVKFYEEKLAEIFRQSRIKSKVVDMEVPCLQWVALHCKEDRRTLGKEYSCKTSDC